MTSSAATLLHEVVAGSEGARFGGDAGGAVGRGDEGGDRRWLEPHGDPAARQPFWARAS